MVTSCASFDCTNRSAKGFHSLSFPKDPVLRNKWLEAIRRPDYVPNNSSKVCGAHFHESDYVRHFGQKMLREGTVPSIFKTCKHRKCISKSCKGPEADNTSTVSEEIIIVVSPEAWTEVDDATNDSIVSDTVDESTGANEATRPSDTTTCDLREELSAPIQEPKKTVHAKDKKDVIFSRTIQASNESVHIPTTKAVHASNGTTQPPVERVRLVHKATSASNGTVTKNKAVQATGDTVCALNGRDLVSYNTDNGSVGAVQASNELTGANTPGLKNVVVNSTVKASNITNTTVQPLTNMVVQSNQTDFLSNGSRLASAIHGKRGRDVLAYFGDFHEKDLTNPVKVRRMWHMAGSKIEQQRKKIKYLQQRNFRLTKQLDTLKKYVLHDCSCD